MAKKHEEGTPTVSTTETVTTDSSRKEELLALLQVLKDLNVRSISDLENLTARA